MRVAIRTRGVGLALILIGVGWYGTWRRWDSTRKWTPLDMPVSLSTGVIRTPEFEINTHSRYRIDLVASPGFGSWDPQSYQYCLPDLGVSWSLWNRGRVVAKGTGQQCDELAKLEAGDGRYVFEVQLSRDGSVFNDHSPHLWVFEVGGVRESSADQGLLAFWSLIVLTTLGTAALIGSTIQRRHENLEQACASTRIRAPATGRAAIVVQRYLADRRTSGRRPLASLSLVSLVAVLFLVPLVLSMPVLLAHATSLGLKVQLLRTDVTVEQGTGIQPVLVQVRLGEEPDAWSRSSLFVNFRLVSKADFEAVLQKELNQRPPNWPVYLEGDPRLNLGPVVQVIDTVQKLHARVVLLAPDRR